ncbi:MAG: hypothetical protein RLZZ401_1553 [Pseudomonadota bacterium]
MPEAAFLPDSVSTRHVFVYGTLRRGDDNDITLLTPAPVFVGQATIAGRMFHLGSYPGVRLGGEGQVQGEVYAITPDLEQQLDEIEGLLPEPTHEYAKRVIAVQVQGGVLACIVYEIDPARALGKPVIDSGDWVQDKR